MQKPKSIYTESKDYMSLRDYIFKIFSLIHDASIISKLTKAMQLQ